MDMLKNMVKLCGQMMNMIRSNLPQLGKDSRRNENLHTRPAIRHKHQTKMILYKVYKVEHILSLRFQDYPPCFGNGNDNGSDNHIAPITQHRQK